LPARASLPAPPGGVGAKKNNMHREFTTAYSIADVDEIEAAGFRLVDPRARSNMRLCRRNADTGGPEYPPGAQMVRHIKE
jgi:hypothetical protein